MRADVDLREIKLKKEWFSGRNLSIVALVVIFGAAAALGWRYITHPPRPWLVRWKLDRYLKSESHAGSFKVDFPFPTKAEMAGPKTKAVEPPPKAGSRTGKSFEALREEYFSGARTSF